MKKERIQAPVNSIVLNEGQIPWLPENPRQWTREDVELTKASLKRDPDFQEDNPLKLVKTQDGKLLAFAGNLRTTAAKELRWKTFEAILYTPETADDEETIRRRALLDNGSFGSWDYDRLADKWNEMPFKELGIKVWDDALGADAKQPAAQAQEDDFDETADAVETRCKTGDIWQLGDHRLMCGDSTDESNFQRLLEGKEARLCVTSPPYGVGKSYEEYGIEPWRKTIFGVIEAITKHARIIVWNIGDLFATGTQFIEPTSMYSTEKMRECGFLPMYARIWKKQGGNFAGTEPYYTVSMKPVQEYEWLLCYGKADYEKDYAPIIKWMAEQARKANLDNKILKEVTGAGFMYGHWFTSHQWAMLDSKNYAKIAKYCAEHGIDAFTRDYAELRRWYEDLNIFGKILTKDDESAWGQWAIWEMATINKRTGDHPAEFPVELPSRFIKMHSRPGDIILEPFCGAGTTLIAAEQLGRKCYGVELDPHYCDIILARWEKLTGQTARKL